jgi:hypothetical protein
MNTTAVEAAERFGQRPGYDLTNFREVGLPIYRQTVIAIVMEEKPLPALQEFALRSIEAGFVTPSAITAFLGLDEGDLNEALYGLISDGFVRVLNTGTTGEELGITERGRAVMEEFRMVRAEEKTYNIDFDGLLRRPIPLRNVALKSRRLRELGAIEIAPSPARKPAVEEFDVTQVEQSLRAVRQLDKSWKVLEILRISKTDTVFVPATMLVFRAKVGDDVQAAFVINGKISEEHELAFAESQGPARLGMIGTSTPDVRAEAEDVVASDVSREVLEAAVKAAQTNNDSVDQTSPTYELLQTFDHPTYLEKALTETQRQLVIVSPWIKSRVVDNAFTGKLRELLRRGVEVYLGYGFGPEDERKDNVEAVRALERLASEFPNFHLVRLGDNHAKVLVSDSSFAIFTSFNWLSFVGDPQRTFRDERGLLVRKPEVVVEAARELITRIQPSVS